MPPPKKKVGGSKKKAKPSSSSSLPPPTPLQSLLSSHRSAIPLLLSTFPHRRDLLYLDLHLLSFPHLPPFTLLLTSTSTLLTLSHALTQRHGPLSSLRLFRSPHSHDELPFHPLTSLADLGCVGGGVEGVGKGGGGGEGEEGEDGGGGGERRYQMWYDVLSEVRGGVCMKEVGGWEKQEGEADEDEAGDRAAREEREGGRREWEDEEKEMEATGLASGEREAAGEGGGNGAEAMGSGVDTPTGTGDEDGRPSEAKHGASAGDAAAYARKAATRAAGAQLGDAASTEQTSTLAAMWS